MSLVWSEKFATGIESIDRQHEKLFSSVNELERLVSLEIFEGPEVDKLLSFVTEYVSMHFNHEEYCMKLAHCQAAEQNKKAHDEFLLYYSDFKKQYQISGARSREALLGELQRVMQKWLDSHICKIDVQLRALRKTSDNIATQNVSID